MKFNTVVFDVDSTLVDFETLEVVIELSLEGRDDKGRVMTEVKRIAESGLKGELPFNESLSRRMALVAPHKRHVEQVAADVVNHITASVLHHKDFFEKNAEHIYIVSGSFDELIFPLSDFLKVPRTHVFANTFVFNEDGIATGVDTTRLLSQHLGKVKALQAAHVPRPLAMIGDGYTDYEVKEHDIADMFIAYTEHTHRDKVVAVADRVASSFDGVLEYLENA